MRLLHAGLGDGHVLLACHREAQAKLVNPTIHGGERDARALGLDDAHLHHGEEGRGNARFEPVLISMYHILLSMFSIGEDFSIDKIHTERLPNQRRPEEGSPRTRMRDRATNR